MRAEHRQLPSPSARAAARALSEPNENNPPVDVKTMCVQTQPDNLPVSPPEAVSPAASLADMAGAGTPGPSTRMHVEE